MIDLIARCPSGKSALSGGFTSTYADIYGREVEYVLAPGVAAGDELAGDHDAPLVAEAEGALVEQLVVG